MSDDTTQAQDDKGVVKLDKPIKAHGEQLSQLVLREPTTEDIMDIGQPFLLIVRDEGAGMEIRPKVIGTYVMRLAGIPMSSVKSLTTNDFGKAQAVVLGFFGKDDSAASSS